MIPVGTEIYVGPVNSRHFIQSRFACLNPSNGNIYLYIRKCPMTESGVITIRRIGSDITHDVSVMDIVLRSINHETCHVVCLNLRVSDRFDGVIEQNNFEVCGL